MEPFHLLFFGMLAIALGQSVCALTCLVRLFVKGEVGMGCASFIPIVGPFILFFYSWSKAEEWEQRRLMIAYSASLAIGLLCGGIWMVALFTIGFSGGR